MELRGSLTVSYNTLVVAGQFVATLVCGAFSHTNQGWRWMLGLAGVPAALQFIGRQTALVQARSEMTNMLLTSYLGHFLPFVVSLWHKGGCHAQKEYITDCKDFWCLEG